MGSLAVIVAGAVSAVLMILIGMAFTLATSQTYALQPDLWKNVNELWYVGTVLLYLLAALLLAVPYERWRKQVTSAQPHVANLW